MVSPSLKGRVFRQSEPLIPPSLISVLLPQPLASGEIERTKRFLDIEIPDYGLAPCSSIYVRTSGASQHASLSIDFQ